MSGVAFSGLRLLTSAWRASLSAGISAGSASAGSGKSSVANKPDFTAGEGSGAGDTLVGLFILRCPILSL